MQRCRVVGLSCGEDSAEAESRHPRALPLSSEVPAMGQIRHSRQPGIFSYLSRNLESPLLIFYISPLESKCSDSGWPPLLSLELEELSDLVSMGVWVMMEGEEVRPGGCGVSGVVRQLLGGSTVTTPGPAAAQLAGSGEVSGEAGKGGAASILER